MKAKLHALLVLAPLVVVMAGCTTTKSTNPLSPSVAGPIAGVVIGTPRLINPAAGTKVKVTEQPITLQFANATTNGVRPLSYVLEVATDANFGTTVFSRSGIPGGDGQTNVQLPDALAAERTYYWRARAEDGANTGSFTSPANFSVYTPVVIDPPGLVSPVDGITVTSRRPTITFNNSKRTGPAGTMSYVVEAAYDETFANSVSGTIPEGSGGQTSYTVPQDLQYGQRVFWHVKAVDSQNNTSLWSVPQWFRTPTAPPPPPTPTPTPTPTPGGPCDSSVPLTIVQCERAKFGSMSTSDILTFEFNVARSLNRNNIPQGPFGVLKKPGGNSCNGYSCDIICSGSGQSQLQWDVLGDAGGANNPQWNGPATYPNIRIDTCDVPK